MAAPVRFPSGVSTASPRDVLANLPFPDPTTTVAWWDDFHTFTAANWTITETQAGATQAVSAGASGGVLLLTNTTGTTDNNQIQATAETFRLSRSKQFWMKSRFALTATTMANFGAVVGLAITDTTAVGGVSDGIFFRKPTGGATLSAVLCLNSTETTITMGTLTTATFVDAGLYYDGRNEVSVWLNGAKVGSSTTMTNFCDDEDLAVTIASLNATAGAANVLSCDYFLAVLER